MSNHNYSQYSNKNNQRINHNNAARPGVKPVEKAAPEVKMEAKPIVMKESVETVTLPETVEGVVANCSKLNVREAPDIESNILCVLDLMSEIEIDVSKSTKDWVHVCTATGVEGYCMRQYVDAHL